MNGFFLAPRIAMGPGAIEQLSSLGFARALVIVDEGVAERRLHRRIAEELAKNGKFEEARVLAHGPSVDAVEAGAVRARDFAPDLLVAVGGGRTIDVAKAIWVRYARPDLDWTRLSPLVELSLRDRARLVAIPTTSGSGGEATWIAHLWDRAGHLIELASRELIPDWALLDPTLPAQMPPALTAETAFDALTHALEAVASAWSTPLSDGLGREAVWAIVRGLPEVLSPRDDLEHRALLHAAATMAGLAQSNAQSGLVHAIAYVLGPALGMSHARTVAILLPFVLEFNFPAARAAYGSLAGALGPAAVQSGPAIAERIRDLGRRCRLPGTFRDAGIEPAPFRERIGEWESRIRSSSSFGANPRIPSSEEIRSLLLRSLGQAATGS
jgi:alcohol dehydrogenase class IV